jgi:hypothetical protein
MPGKEIGTVIPNAGNHHECQTMMSPPFFGPQLSPPLAPPLALLDGLAAWLFHRVGAANQSRRHAKPNIPASAPIGAPQPMLRIAASARPPIRPPIRALASNPKTHIAIVRTITLLLCPPGLLGLTACARDRGVFWRRGKRSLRPPSRRLLREPSRYRSSRPRMRKNTLSRTQRPP